MSAPLTCREVAERLDDYLADALPATARAAFDGRLAACPSCVAYVHGYRASIDVSRAAIARSDRQEADLPEDLIQSILSARTRASP